MKAQNYGRIAVLCGGPGGERDVSLNSGREVHAVLARSGFDNELVEVPEENPDTLLEALDCDVAIMMFHGEFGEGGEAQEILERKNIPFSGSSSGACQRAMNKAATKILMRNNHIPTPRWTTADSPSAAAVAVEAAGLKFPLFVKPNYGGSSVGVSRVNDSGSLEEAVAKALESDRLSLIEEMVIGRELTSGWLNGRLLPLVEMHAEGEFYDYNAKYISNGTGYTCPAVIDPEVADAIGGHALQILSALGVRDVGRVDVMLGENGPMLLEVNTLPGFTSHSLLPLAASRAGYPIEQVCLMLVEMAASRTGDGEAQ